MPLSVGSPAPRFTLKDVFARTIDLNQYRGRKVLVAFFRHAGCPFCNIRVHHLSKAHEELKSLGLDMIFFFESKEKVILRSSFHQGVSPIPIISDPEKTWYKAYGMESSFLKSTTSHITSFVPTVIEAKKLGVPVHAMASGESFNTIPAEFLLDENLVIRKVLYSKELNDRLPIEDVFRFARTTQSTS